MNDWISTLNAIFLVLASWMVAAFHELAPMLTGFTFLCGLILGCHAIARLIYRLWTKGLFNSIKDAE